MTTEITNQLAATKLKSVGPSDTHYSQYTNRLPSEASSPSDANWKDGLKMPSKDLRPQTEVCTKPLQIIFARIY
jgi:ATP-dependent RNA helicase DDX6/DHH1